ncbi:hypothetical protein Rhe02_06350 [Rhizocola hellebori]|uniref:Uncharacterized protein n=1 Tax=Rhizocola hellebori TaxID=1392758 RepID=A0A8J3Q2C0_9ACTN|nr:hypothetical protein Rhe02_06350 [Rhizocola hellebori]
MLSALLVPLLIEIFIGVALTNGPAPSLSRLGYLTVAGLGVLVAITLWQPLIKRQLPVVAGVQATLGVAMTVAGVSSSIFGWPFAASAGTVLAIVGPMIAVTAGYMIVVDLHYVDIKTVPGMAVRKSDHHHWPLNGGQQAYARMFDGTSCHPELLDDCMRVVDTGGVHFVAAFADGHCQFYVDVLHSSALANLVAPLTADERRARLERAGRQLIALDHRIAAGLRRIERGKLAKATIEVEDGELVLYRLRRGHYLLGATLSPAYSEAAQRNLEVLAQKYQRPRGDARHRAPAATRDLVVRPSTVSHLASGIDAAQLIAEQMRDEPAKGSAEIFKQYLPQGVAEPPWMNPNSSRLEPAAAVMVDGAVIGVINLNALFGPRNQRGRSGSPVRENGADPIG